jgi:hypothetical protein
MAGFLAIAGVSATLRSLLRDRMEQPVTVTIAPPDVTVAGVNGRRVNLYLYQLSENGALKNQDIPGRGHPADYGRPPLSLDLHYVVTAYGASETGVDADLEAQQILGDAMRVLHEFPIVSDTLHEGDDPAQPRILDASLVGEFERVKITLQPTGLDEFSKIWTALPQANFRRSVAYQVSVVQIESRQPRRPSLPVRERRVHAVTLRTPHIEEILRDPPFPGAPGAVAEVGDTLLVLGRSLAGQSTRVALGATTLGVPAPTDTRLTLTVPAAVPAGLHAVQVVHDLLLVEVPGQPLVPHRGFRSNVVPLVVVPRLAGIVPPAAGPGATVTVTVDPPVTAGQEAVLLLGDFEVPADPVDPSAPPSTTIGFTLPAGPARIPAGVHVARVRVDGAESRLAFDPVTLQYTGPTFTVT